MHCQLHAMLMNTSTLAANGAVQCRPSAHRLVHDAAVQNSTCFIIVIVIVCNSSVERMCACVQDYTQILAHRETQIKENERKLGVLIAQNDALAAAQKERDATIAKHTAALAAADEKLEDARTVMVDKERLEEQVVSQMEVR